MENNLTLEQELTARIMVHKMSIAGGVLMQDYMKSNYTAGGVNLPDSTLTDMADEYSEQVMKKAMENGTFNELYEKAWDKIKNTIPEYTKVI
jgi:hypothetical protein